MRGGRAQFQAELDGLGGERSRPRASSRRSRATASAYRPRWRSMTAHRVTAEARTPSSVPGGDRLITSWSRSRLSRSPPQAPSASARRSIRSRRSGPYAGRSGRWARATPSQWALLAGAVAAACRAASVRTVTACGSQPVSDRSTWCARSLTGAPTRASSAAASRCIRVRSRGSVVSWTRERSTGCRSAQRPSAPGRARSRAVNSLKSASSSTSRRPVTAATRAGAA